MTTTSTGEITAVSVETIGRFGRYLVGSGRNHFVSDQRVAAGGPGEAVTAGELLLASLGSCSLGLIEKTALEAGIEFAGGVSEVAFKRHESDPTRYDWIRIEVRLAGVTEAEAATLVAGFTSRCPIYNTLKRGGPIDITWKVN